MWIGRLLILGVLVFWWGGIAAPRLISLALPAILPEGAIPWHLDPEQEGSVANAMSSGAFVVVALLALGNAFVSRRRAAGWVAAGSWAALAVVTALVAWAEISDAHNSSVADAVRLVFGADRDRDPWTKPALLSPLAVAFGLALWVFTRKALPTSSARTLWALGLGTWLLGAIFDAMNLALLAAHRIGDLAIIAEETLEFGGALLIGLSAAISLGTTRNRDCSAGGIRWRPTVAGAVITVAALGALVVGLVFRVPLIDTRPPTHIDGFELSLYRQEALVQEFRMPFAPIRQLDVRLANRDPHGTVGAVGIRFIKHEAGTARVLSQTSVKNLRGGRPQRQSIELTPPVAEAEGQPLTLELIADIEPAAEVRVSATRAHQYADGRLWINGALAWPDQDLAFVAYGAPEPTRSKLMAIWRLLTSDWRWPALLAGLAAALTLTTLIPAVVAASVLPKRDRGRGNRDSPTTGDSLDAPSLG